MANHPWIQVIALDEALDGETVNRDLTAADGPQAQDWVHHAANQDYDNWFYGSARHEGLAPKLFEVRIGTNLPSGALYGSMTNGLLSNAWAAVQGITNADVKRLAQQTLFASTFETAFHNEDNGDLTRWSFGDYASPAADWQGLQGFAWKAQGQTAWPRSTAPWTTGPTARFLTSKPWPPTWISTARTNISCATTRSWPSSSAAAAGWSAPGASPAPTSSR
jgi:hypothetical protein